MEVWRKTFDKVTDDRVQKNYRQAEGIEESRGQRIRDNWE